MFSSRFKWCNSSCTLIKQLNKHIPLWVFRRYMRSSVGRQWAPNAPLPSPSFIAKAQSPWRAAFYACRSGHALGLMSLLSAHTSPGHSMSDGSPYWLDRAQGTGCGVVCAASSRPLPHSQPQTFESLLILILIRLPTPDCFEATLSRLLTDHD